MKRHIIIVIAFTLHTLAAQSNTAPGYIVTNNSDTIAGEVKVSRYDIYTGGILCSGINLEPFHSVLYFRQSNQSSFKSFRPKDISGFVFTYKSVDYIFKTFTIESKSIVKSERRRLRFLNLIHQSENIIYRDIVRRGDVVMPGTQSKVTDYYDYYSYDITHGLKKLDAGYRPH